MLVLRRSVDEKKNLFENLRLRHRIKRIGRMDGRTDGCTGAAPSRPNQSPSRSASRTPVRPGSVVGRSLSRLVTVCSWCRAMTSPSSLGRGWLRPSSCRREEGTGIDRSGGSRRVARRCRFCRCCQCAADRRRVEL